MCAVALTRLDDLRYDPETHTTTLPDGTDVPHVTHILDAVRVRTDFEELSDLGPRHAERIKLAGARGTAVHADCHAYDDDDLDWDMVDERVRPYVEAWAQFREDKGIRPMVRERRLFHRRHRFTGIMDGLFVTLDGRQIIADIKTGDPAAAAGHLQTAAYQLALEDMQPDLVVHERWAVWLRPGRTVPYTVENYSARPDAATHMFRFLACLTVYREQQQLRAKR